MTRTISTASMIESGLAGVFANSSRVYNGRRAKAEALLTVEINCRREVIGINLKETSSSPDFFCEVEDGDFFFEGLGL